MIINNILKLQTCGKFFYIAATGGGTSFIGDFLKTPGGSAVIVGGNIPYSQNAFIAFAGKCDKYSDVISSRKLANQSYKKCVDSVPYNVRNCVGIGISCSLEKNNERENRRHTANITIHTIDYVYSIELSWPSGNQSRDVEENFVNNITLDVLYNLFIQNYNLNKLSVEFNRTVMINDLSVNITYYYHSLINIDTLTIYPGSFNPLHNGHTDIFKLAGEIINSPIYYELSGCHSYKPSVDFGELSNRIDQFTDQNLIMTGVARFVDKVKFLKNTYNVKNIIIVVGADIWSRVYDATADANDDINFFDKNNVKFLVFGRSVEVKMQDSKLFIRNEKALSFENPISSTLLRNTLTLSKG